MATPVVSPTTLSEILPNLNTDALRTFLETSVLPNLIPEPVPEIDNDVFPTCPTMVYSSKYRCMLPGWVYKQGYDI
jgi:hypothetical protein